MTDIHTIAENCFRDEAQSLLDMIPLIDENFDRAVQLLFQCKGHVVVTGVGKSGHVGAKIAATLSSTGTPSVYISALDAMHGDMGMIVPADLVLMISNSGNTDELLRIVAALEQRHIPIVSMTGHSDSLLARHSDVHVLVHVDKEACPLNLAPTSSTTAQMAMGDALAIALMELRHFKAADFASFHPGGSIGRKLVTRVKDVMYTENFPIIPRDMHDQRVFGIITDGDIRRAVENRKQNFLSVKVSDVMTLHPKTINPEAKLAQIQLMFRRHKIHSLLVVDDDQHLIGIVDYFAIMN